MPGAHLCILFTLVHTVPLTFGIFGSLPLTLFFTAQVLDVRGIWFGDMCVGYTGTLSTLWVCTI